MHLGYHWTAHIGGLLSLAERSLLDNGIITNNSAARTFERLASVDMAAWIIGRRTPPLHIWSTWCSGGNGIEKITGLPRSLLDLIGRASLREDVAEELTTWFALLRMDDSTPAEYHIWQAYCIGSLLQLHLWEVATVDNPDSLVTLLTSHVEGFWAFVDVDVDVNPRMAVWPLYVVGAVARDEPTWLYVTGRLEHQALYRDFRCRNSLLKILKETWARRAHGEAITPDIVARENNLEVGIW
jgi:hypothetical protein